MGQHPHPFNSYGLKAEDSQVVGGTRTQRDTLKQFHLHFSLRLDRGTRGENSTGQDRTGQERSCSLTVSGFMLPPCNVIKNMSASALDGAPVASGKLRVFTQCEHTPSSLLSPVITARRGQCIPLSPILTHSFILFPARGASQSTPCLFLVE